MSFKRLLNLENHVPTAEVASHKPNHYVNE